MNVLKRVLYLLFKLNSLNILNNEITNDCFINSYSVAKQEIMALTQMAEQINSKFSAQQHHQQHQRKSDIFPNGIKASNESVDLDNLFAFLSEVTPNGPNSNAIINEIGERMNHLVDDLDVELESVIQQEIEGLTNEKNLAKSQAAQPQTVKPQPQNIQPTPPAPIIEKQQQVPPPIQPQNQQVNHQQLSHSQQQVNHQIPPQPAPPQQTTKMG